MISFWKKWCIAVGSMFFALSLFALSACGGGDDGDKSSAAESSIESSYETKEDLPSCTSKRMAEVESTEDGKMYVCYDDSWKKIDYTEDEMEDLPSCTEKRDGLVAFLSSSVGFVVCKNEKWQKQTSASLDNPKESSSSVVSSSSGDVDGGSENVSSSSSVKTSYVEVKTKTDLIECNSSNKDVRALLLSDSTYYTCNGTEWKKDEGYIGYDVVADRENLPQCNAGNAKQRVFAKKDSVFFVCDSVKWEPEHAEGYLVRNASILGAAHKGPFKFGSPLLLREMLLRNDSLIYSGREYVDEISSNAGDFVIPKVSMIYPYAVLEVRGLWRNEVTGEWSKDSMTLHVLTDLTKRTDVNINLLTHLEYNRAVALVNKGYSVYAAKKQADYEIITALGFATTVEYSENLKTFVASTNSYYDANSTLMAISLLFIGNRSEAEIQKVVDEFRKDVADDGEWNGASAEATKAEMADWAESFDTTPVRANVKTWNIVDIPSYENYLVIFWNNAYGLGGCASTRYGVVSVNTNKSSQNYNVHYICEAKGWRKATDFEKDTYEWSDGKSGEVKKGNVTETYYVFENGKWGVATELQYDTYQFGAGKEGEVRKGKVNTSKYYVYENGSWRAAKNEIENVLGACVVNREGEVGKVCDSYYACKSKIWETSTSMEYDLGVCSAKRLNEVVELNEMYYTCKSIGWTESTTLEYDTYGWNAGVEGEVRVGKVNKDKYYVYENAAWRVSSNVVENNLGACVTSREGEKQELNGNFYACKSKEWLQITLDVFLGKCTSEDEGVIKKTKTVYYVCKSKSWRKASVLEYDTYGKICTSSEIGEIINGVENIAYKYYCTANGWVNLTIGWSWDVPKGVRLNSEITYGSMTDSRDKKVYRTVKIGEQLWMAENLDYTDSILTPNLKGKSSCYKKKEANCAVAGRLYTWDAAIDSADCSDKYCYLPDTVYGICPPGWHIPTKNEWNALLVEVGGQNNAGLILKSQTGWYGEGNGTDAFGFSALPVGYMNLSESFDEGRYAFFWSATDYSGYHAYIMYLTDSEFAHLDALSKDKKYSVRCLKD